MATSLRAVAAFALLGALAAPAFAQVAAPPIEIVVDRDNVVISTSCRLRIANRPIADADGNGVVRIVADGVTVELAGTLRGAPVGTDPDTLAGIGIVVEAKNVVVANGAVAGFKVGVKLDQADGSTVENLDLSDNFAQRLRSTPQAEDASDWLWPHRNDDGEWAANYGAGLLVRDSRDVVIRGNKARRTQNGILLERVEGAKVFDNDCSFLSGWGLALWRSSRNTIVRNAFDFCVRGYSHGVYNRGQDSAGILLFEQCSENLIALNSATHGGDGLFGFAGREALGESPAPEPDAAWHRHRGNTGNRIVANDFSFAVAHGIEMTFSHANLILGNRLEGCGICGVWGGYSSDTLVAGNDFRGNGESGYGAERGGVNIEHGRGNRIVSNRFEGNACGVRLWWDEDETLARLPWSIVNGVACEGNVIAGNRFRKDEVAIELLACGETAIEENEFIEVGAEIVADDTSLAAIVRRAAIGDVPDAEALLRGLPGTSNPIGRRAALAGRDRIVITEWAPYAWDRPLLIPVAKGGARDRYRLLAEGASAKILGASVFGAGSLRTRIDPATNEIEVFCERPGMACPYRLEVLHGEGGRRGSRSKSIVEGLIAPASWKVRVFPYASDPIEALDAWRAEAAAESEAFAAAGGVEGEVPSIDFPFAMGGPNDVASLGAVLGEATLPPDRFGLVAETSLQLPKGRFRFRVLSDDGVRLTVGDRVLVERWDRHGPTTDLAEIEFAEATEVPIRVEHFELDGYAVLKVEIEGAER
ncbi:MAG: NosD domain-containing protein [Phycisphaerales bacterium]